MKLINAAVEGDEGLEVKKYPMPVKGAEGTVNINGEDVATKATSGRGQAYTYFILNNVALYVAGTLDPDAKYVMDLPEGFGSDTPPAERKSYYVRKRPSKMADGSVAPGANDATGAPHTEVRDGVEVAVNPDGSVVSSAAQEAALAGETLPEGEGGEPASDGEHNPDGSAIEEPTESPKSRKRK